MRSALVLWALLAGALCSPTPTQTRAEQVESRGELPRQGRFRALTESQSRKKDHLRAKEDEKAAEIRSPFEESAPSPPFKRGEDEQRAHEEEKAAKLRSPFEESAPSPPFKRGKDDEQRAHKEEKAADPLGALRKLPVNGKADTYIPSRAESETPRKRPSQQRAKPIERTRELKMQRTEEQEKQMLPERNVAAEPRIRRQGLPQDRGVNWENGTKGEFKFLVRMTVYYQKGAGWFRSPCGAALIASQYIVTAAHCFDKQKLYYENNVKPELTYSYFNDYSLSNPDESDVMKASHISIHPNYDKKNHPSMDIAVVKLARAVDYRTGTNLELRNIPLDGSFIGGGVDVTIAGWGKEGESASSLAPNMYHSSKEKTMTNAECRNTAYSASEIEDNMLCATGTYNGQVQDACQGDSGGPMFTGSGDSVKLVGVVSWGRGCANSNYPGVYARVSVLKSWVETEVQG